MKHSSKLLWAVVVIQTLCAGFFVFDLTVSVLGLRTTATSWQMREVLEISASLGLILGAVLGLRSVLEARGRAQRAEQALRSAAGEFAAVVEERFSEWGLTPSERDVAWYSVKGFNTQKWQVSAARLRALSRLSATEFTAKQACRAEPNCWRCLLRSCCWTGGQWLSVAGLS